MKDNIRKYVFFATFICTPLKDDFSQDFVQIILIKKQKNVYDYKEVTTYRCVCVHKCSLHKSSVYGFIETPQSIGYRQLEVYVMDQGKFQTLLSESVKLM